MDPRRSRRRLYESEPPEEIEIELMMHPDHIPIAFHPARTSSISIRSAPHLVHKSTTLSHTLRYARNHIRGLESQKTIFMYFRDGSLAPLEATMADVYEKYKDDDKVLHLIFTDH